MTTSIPDAELIRRLRSRREMMNYGNGDVRDVPDEDCELAADRLAELSRELAACEGALKNSGNVARALSTPTPGLDAVDPTVDQQLDQMVLQFAVERWMAYKPDTRALENMRDEWKRIVLHTFADLARPYLERAQIAEQRLEEIMGAPSNIAPSTEDDGLPNSAIRGGSHHTSPGLEEMRRALEPFAKAAALFDNSRRGRWKDSDPVAGAGLTVKHLRNAQATFFSPPIHGDRQTALEALTNLAEAEEAYRRAYEGHAGEHINTGRAWDQMRRAGDEARALINQPAAKE